MNDNVQVSSKNKHFQTFSVIQQKNETKSGGMSGKQGSLTAKIGDESIFKGIEGSSNSGIGSNMKDAKFS